MSDPERLCLFWVCGSPAAWTAWATVVLVGVTAVYAALTWSISKTSRESTRLLQSSQLREERGKLLLLQARVLHLLELVAYLPITHDRDYERLYDAEKWGRLDAEQIELVGARFGGRLYNASRRARRHLDYLTSELDRIRLEDKTRGFALNATDWAKWSDHHRGALVALEEVARRLRPEVSRIDKVLYPRRLSSRLRGAWRRIGNWWSARVGGGKSGEVQK